MLRTMQVTVKAGGHTALINESDFDPAKFARIDESLTDEDDNVSSSALEDEDDAAFEAATPKKSRRGRK